MTLNDLIQSFRVDADDRIDPFLWEDDEVTRFFNEAEDEACIRARLIREKANTSICQIAVVNPTTTYALDPRIVEIAYASMVYAGAAAMFPYVLAKTSSEELDQIRPYWRAQTYRPTAIIQYDDHLELDCIPDASYTINLEVFRLPLTPMAKDTDTPEIVAKHHRHLVQWALHRAYQKPDTETLNLNKSALAETEFEKYFGSRPNADLRKRQQANRPHRNRAIW